MDNHNTTSTNVFEILATADKELVHSSMLKFLLLDERFKLNEYFVLPQHNNLNVILEYSEKVDNKRLRFDIVGCESSEKLNDEQKPKGIFNKDSKVKPIFIIENKFKATPTKNQLKLYDDFLKPYKPDREIKKILMVFMRQQVPSVVQDYCCDNKWLIKSYFDFDNNDSLYNFLIDLKIDNSALDTNTKYIIRSYISYLRKYYDAIKELISCTNYVEFNPDNRFIHSQYMMYLQAKIADKANDIIKAKGFNVTNDGGGNTIPNVAFWNKVTSPELEKVIKWISFGIDGNSFKLSVHYLRSENELFNKKIKPVTDAVTPITENLKTLVFTTLKKTEVKQNDTSNKDKTSCYSLFSFQANENIPVEDIIQESAFVLEAFLNHEVFTSDAK